MTDNIEKDQKRRYPGLTVMRDGDVIAVRNPGPLSPPQRPAGGDAPRRCRWQ